MNGILTTSQIFDLMVERPGSAEGRDAALAAIPKLSPTEVKVLAQRIVDASQPGTVDHPSYQVPFVRGYLLGQLGKISAGFTPGINLLLRHVQPEFEPDHWVRYWAFTGCIASKTEKNSEVATWLLHQYEGADPGNDHKMVMLSYAYRWSAQPDEGMTAQMAAPLQEWIRHSIQAGAAGGADLQERCQNVLRALGTISVPPLVELVTEILNSKYSDPRTKMLAAQALALVPHRFQAETGMAVSALVRFIGGFGNTRVLAGVRREAVVALGKLGLADAEYHLIKELRAGSLDMIKAASVALVQVIGMEKAVQRILEASAADENPHTRNNFAIALRWMSDDKEAVTESLHQASMTGNAATQEIARGLMAEMGGAAALQKLTSRKKAVDEFKSMLLKEQDKFQKRFDETMEEARTGFRIAIMMDVVVFGLGIVMLVAFMIYAFATDTVDNFVGVGLGGLGTLGVVYGTLIANPRKKVFRSVNSLMNFKVIFLAYLRQLHQADQTFTRHILEDEHLSTETLNEFTTMIGEMLEEAVEKMVHLKQQELREKVVDYNSEYKMRSLDVKQRIAEVKYGYGRKFKDPNLPSPTEPSSEYSDPPSFANAEPLPVFEPNQDATSSPVQLDSHGNETPAENQRQAEPVKLKTAPPVSETQNKETQSSVPNEVLQHLRLREGWRTKVYLDSVGKPTVGLGHLLTADEKQKYPVGTELPESILMQWAQQDSQKAYDAARKQAQLIGKPEKELVHALTAVNFQLGTGWADKFRKTWAYLKAHDWEKAALESEDSAWFRQTPVRVRDFQQALRNLSPGQKHSAPAAPAFAPPPPASSGKISAGVGKGGANKAADVRLIQSQLLTLGYLRDRSEYQAASTLAREATVGQLQNTIEAIREFQKYSLGISRPDGRIDPNGNTMNKLAERMALIAKFSRNKIESKSIPPVIGPAQWISQFPTDNNANGEGRGLKESEKAYPGKNNNVCCWDAANATVRFKVSGIRHDISHRIVTFHQKDGKGYAMAKQTELGIKYIDHELINGRPVMVGVDDGRTASYNADDTTEHFVVIVAKIIKEGKIHYQFFDPGSRRGPEKGYNPNNLLRLQDDFLLRGFKPGQTQKQYTVAQIRQNIS